MSDYSGYSITSLFLLLQYWHIHLVASSVLTLNCDYFHHRCWLTRMRTLIYLYWQLILGVSTRVRYKCKKWHFKSRIFSYILPHSFTTQMLPHTDAILNLINRKSRAVRIILRSATHYALDWNDYKHFLRCLSIALSIELRANNFQRHGNLYPPPKN